MENSQESDHSESLNTPVNSSGVIHKFIAIGPQTEDLLRESDLLGKNSEVVYSVDSVNQWDIESTPLQADLVVIECTTVFPETVQIIKEKHIEFNDKKQALHWLSEKKNGHLN